MQISEKKPGAKPWKPKEKEEKSVPIEPKTIVFSTSKEPDLDFKSKLKQEPAVSSEESSSELLSTAGALLGVGGAHIANSAHTVATACRMTATNPVLLGVGIAFIVIGAGIALYFKYF